MTRADAGGGIPAPPGSSSTAGYPPPSSARPDAGTAGDGTHDGPEASETPDTPDTPDSPDSPDSPDNHGLTGTSQPRTPGPSLRPALVVVGLAVFLVLIFGIGSALTDNPSPKAPRPSVVKGTDLVAVPAAADLHPIEILGTPPSDILDALVIPRGVHKVSVTRWSGSTQYDAKMSFRLASSQATLVDFFRSELHARGWSIQSVGAARGEKGATEVLAQHASSDGWYWEAGVVVSPTTFARGATSANVTRFSLELYELPDAT